LAHRALAQPSLGPLGSLPKKKLRDEWGKNREGTQKTFFWFLFVGEQSNEGLREGGLELEKKNEGAFGSESKKMQQEKVHGKYRDEGGLDGCPQRPEGTL